MPWRVSIFLAVLCAAATAAAQLPVRVPREEELRRMRENRQPAKAKGTIQAVQADVVHVVGEGEGKEPKQWLVKMPADRSQIHFAGKAAIEWVQPGMYVRFTADFDARGRPLQPVQKLEVITLRPQRRAEQPDMPGVFPTNPGAGGFFDHALGNAPAAPKSWTCRVIAQVVKTRKGELVLNAGGKALSTEVADNVEVTVELGDFRWAQLGDEIDVEGFAYPPMLQNIYASRVTIKAVQMLAAPAAGGKEKPGTQPKSRWYGADKL